MTECINDTVVSSFGTETIFCQLCGISFDKNKIGRTRDYCSDPCRLFSKYKNLAERELLKIDFDNNAGRLVRGDLFSMANLIKIKKD